MFHQTENTNAEISIIKKEPNRNFRVEKYKNLKKKTCWGGSTADFNWQRISESQDSLNWDYPVWGTERKWIKVNRAAKAFGTLFSVPKRA